MHLTPEQTAQLNAAIANMLARMLEALGAERVILVEEKQRLVEAQALVRA